MSSLSALVRARAVLPRTCVSNPNNTFSLLLRSSFSSTASNSDAALSRRERKAATKELRRQRFEYREAQRASLPTRRANRPRRGAAKAAFHEWFDPRRDEDSYHDRRARRRRKERDNDGDGVVDETTLWSVRVAAVVERLPVLTPDMEDWEKDYEDLLDVLVENDRRYPADTPFGESVDADGASSRPRLPWPSDEPSAWDEFAPSLSIPGGVAFRPAPRVTEADRANDVRSLNRALAERVYLTTAADDDNDDVFPTVDLGPDETFAAAAKRAATDFAGESLVFWNVGNCPMAVDVRPYDDSDTHPCYGEKTFYFKLQRLDGDVDHERERRRDHAWATRKEIVDRVTEAKGEDAGRLHHYLL